MGTQGEGRGEGFVCGRASKFDMSVVKKDSQKRSSLPRFSTISALLSLHSCHRIRRLSPSHPLACLQAALASCMSEDRNSCVVILRFHRELVEGGGGGGGTE
mmetsp:Transcript_26071/g.51147  ORF Transcript_26071/g.51147 Transcript_26071/m.51147 type:complete len:102 (-) Transcript_26071:1032-1337(-)